MPTEPEVGYIDGVYSHLDEVVQHVSQVSEFLVLEVVDLFVECLGRVGREDAGLLQFVLGLSDRLRVGRVTGYSLVQDALSMEFLPGGQKPH